PADDRRSPTLRPRSPKPTGPTDQDAYSNRRARLARLRAAERTAATAYPAPGKEAA
ncbi:16S rRNA (cytosine(1402)-N(4))-methyltransferase, partial [Azospirillum brasilense]|nr:16S rRNA (cytosine(1402)-N(4))-methyltransferase [Azospirillum brasilense]